MGNLLGLAVLGSAMVFLGACGGDSGETTCQLHGGVSGAVSWQSSSDPACVSAFSSSSGVDMDFRLLETDIKQYVVHVPGIKPGMTGALPAQVEVTHKDNRTWKTSPTGCTVTIEVNSFVMDVQFGKRYQLDGHGECASAAMPSGAATGTVTITPFTFRFQTTFT